MGAAGAFVCLLVAACGADSRTERFAVISNGETVGELTAERTGDTVSIDYAVDNNGRGPKIREQLTLGDDGRPRYWEIRGESLFGAAVEEQYAFADGRARWESQADEGSARGETPALYVGNDASPWAYGMYARTALAGDGTVALLPSGRLRVEPLCEVRIGDPAVPVTFHRLLGIELTPRLIALDEARRLFAVMSGRGLVIRKGYEHASETMLKVARSLDQARRRELHGRLAHRYGRPLLIGNVRVFDPASGTGDEPVSVLVREGRIAAVGPQADEVAAADAVVVDGEGGTLLAGLTDMHAHNSYDSGLFYLAAGVTSTRDMGNDTALLERLRDEYRNGESAGPRIAPAGLIEARSPYSARIGIVAETLEEALDAVRWYADRGYYEIKTYNSMNAEWIRPLVAEAERHGLGVTGHVPAFTSPDAMIGAGFDSIAHINQLMLGWLLEPGEDTRTPLRLTGMKRAADLDLHSREVTATIELMRERGTAQDTTAIILERLMKSRAGEVQPGDAPYLDHMPIGYQRSRRRTFVPLGEPGDDAAYDAAFDKVLATIGLLHDNGIPLLIGTDDGTGFSVHRELELYVEAGIPTRDTLRIATAGAARYLDRRDELGSIEPGKLADFLLVDGDPEQDISAIRRVRLASKGGVLYFPDEIYAALGIEPFVEAARPAATAEGGTSGSE